MISTQPAMAINVNFDSLSEAYGFPPAFRDPSYFQIFDRFLSLLARRGFPCSIYVIGKDLENPEVFARVRAWSEMGHEIGNHTWSHPADLGTLHPDLLRDEITRAHEIIALAARREPRGFIAPGWSTSEKVISVLIDLKYLYDTSLFPSVWIFPVIAKVALNHLAKPGEALRSLRRADWAYCFEKPGRSFIADRSFSPVEMAGEETIVELPLPTFGRFSLPYWHTTAFISGWERARGRLKKCLEKVESFYYLFHPADWTGREDLPDTGGHGLQRMNVSLSEKMRILEQALEDIASSGREVITMENLALRFKAARSPAI